MAQYRYCQLIFLLYRMTSLQQKHRRYREYSQKAIINKINPEFIGIAKSYSSAKKQRIMSEQLKRQYSHEVSTMNKINKNLQKTLKKKHRELTYIQQVRGRYISEVLEKQKRKRSQEYQLQKMRKRTVEEKTLNQIRLKQSKERLQLRRKLETAQTKDYLDHLKSYKKLKQSRVNDINHSRVKQIEQDKKRINDYCNRFFQNRNKKFMQSYKNLIDKQKKSQVQQKIQTTKLEQKLVILKQRASNKQKALNNLNQSIDSMRQLSSSRRSSRVITTRSMTPLKILTADAKYHKQSDEKVKLKKL